MERGYLQSLVEMRDGGGWEEREVRSFRASFIQFGHVNWRKQRSADVFVTLLNVITWSPYGSRRWGGYDDIDDK